MAQIESPANLDRWPDPACRLVTLILVRCGLRISSARTLTFGCLLYDGHGAPYLRYFNTKIRREAAVPIDEELEAGIHARQRRVLQRWPDGSPYLFPGPTPIRRARPRWATAPTAAGCGTGSGPAMSTTNTAGQSI
jgi:integrase